MSFIVGALREWTGIQQFPSATQSSLLALLNRLKDKDKDSLNILVLGKSGMGKSSTINSIFGERICSVSSFQADSIRPVQCSRTCAGFTINIYDTPGLVEAGSVSDHAIDAILGSLLDKSIDAVLYIDRLDDYRVTNLDSKIIRAITRAFGSQIWKITALVFTHAQVASPEGVEYADFVSRRTSTLSALVQKESGLKSGVAQFPVVLVENSSRCNVNEEGEKILPDGSVWLTKLVETIVHIVEGGAPPLLVDQKLIDGPNYNNRWKPLIPVVALLQYFFIIRPLQKVIIDDAELENSRRPQWELNAEEYVRRGSMRASLEKQAKLRNSLLGRGKNY